MLMKIPRFKPSHAEIKTLDAHQILARYAEGHRDFRHHSLYCLSFVNKDLSGADFSYSTLIGTSFLKCRLDHTKFRGCHTGQPFIAKVAIVLFCICMISLSTFFAAFFSVYGSSTGTSKFMLIFFSLLLYCSFTIERLGDKSFSNQLPYSIAILFGLALTFLIFNEFRMQSINDGLSFLFSFSFLSFSLLMQVVGNAFSRSLASLFAAYSKQRSGKATLKSLIVAGASTAFFSCIIIMSAPNQIGIITNIIFVVFTVFTSWLSVFDSICKIIIANLSRLNSMGNTSFKGSWLISSDFSLASLAGVDFRDSELSYVCWVNTNDFDKALFGKVIQSKMPFQKSAPSTAGAIKSMNLYPSLPLALAQAKRSSRLVPFVGSGLSRGPDVKGGFPSWRELPARLLDSCDFYDVWYNESDRKTLRERFLESDPTDQTRMQPRAVPLLDMLRQLDQVKHKLGHNYANAITSIFRPVDAKPGSAHRAIIALNAPLVITTNFDKLIEIADSSSDRTMYSGKNASAALADIRQNRPVLFKVHGTAEDIDSLVLTLEEYGSVRADEAYKKVLNYLLIDRTFLFVGYGMDDPEDLDLVLSNTANQLKGATGPHFALLKRLPDPQHDVDRKDRLRREYNVVIISYKDHVELVPFLQMLAEV